MNQRSGEPATDGGRQQATAGQSCVSPESGVASIEARFSKASNQRVSRARERKLGK